MGLLRISSYGKTLNLFVTKWQDKHSPYIHSSNINCALTLCKTLGWQVRTASGEGEMKIFNKPKLWLIKHIHSRADKKRTCIQ